MEVLEPFLQINPRELSSFTAAPSFNFPPNFLCNSFSLPPHYEFCLFHCLYLLQQYFKSKFTSEHEFSAHLGLSPVIYIWSRFGRQISCIVWWLMWVTPFNYFLSNSILFVCSQNYYHLACLCFIIASWCRYPGFVHTHCSITCNSISIFGQLSQLFCPHS